MIGKGAVGSERVSLFSEKRESVIPDFNLPLTNLSSEEVIREFVVVQCRCHGNM